MGKWQIALAALQQLPTIISFVEQLIPSAGKSADKKQAATAELTKYEGALALDQRVKDAKAALIDAQVEYLNAMDAAEAQARTLGVPIGMLPAGLVPPPAAPLTTTLAGAGAAVTAQVTERGTVVSSPTPALQPPTGGPVGTAVSATTLPGV